MAQKIGMTSVFLPDGKMIAVTVCKAAPLKVTQIKTLEKDKYAAVQVAYGSKKTLDGPTKAKLSKISKDLKPKAFKEFKLTSEALPEVGSDIAIDSVFAAGDSVTITGTSKGRGFAGVIKRYGFQRQPVSGGQSDRVRAPGAIGAQTPGKVIKGKKMPGHYGNKSKTVSGLKIVAIDPVKNEISITGPFPGSVKSWVIISKA